MTPLFLSAFVAPGAGQLYRREFLKGGLILGLCLFGLAWLFVDLCYIVSASLQADPSLDPEELFKTAIEIRKSISLRRFVTPVIIFAVSYLWGVIDILRTMRKESQSGRPTREDEKPQTTETDEKDSID